MEKEKQVIMFEEINEEELFADYSRGCSGQRSDCCTKVCTRNGNIATADEWGKFLDIEGGVIQY